MSSSSSGMARSYLASLYSFSATSILYSTLSDFSARLNSLHEVSTLPLNTDNASHSATAAAEAMRTEREGEGRGPMGGILYGRRI